MLVIQYYLLQSVREEVHDPCQKGAFDTIRLRRELGTLSRLSSNSTSHCPCWFRVMPQQKLVGSHNCYAVEIHVVHFLELGEDSNVQIH